jgi:hypothetical protein
MFQKMLPNGIFPRDCLLYWDGGPADRIKKTAFTNTDTAVGTNIHRANSITFNGTTSKIDCGSDVVGVGDITVLGWINAAGFGEGNLGRIIHNGKFQIRINTTNDLFDVSSDNATVATSATNSVVVATEIFFAVTRTAAGAANIYVNGVLSGSADQASGVPAPGTTNAFIGNLGAASGTFDGTLSHIRIFSKILTTTQIGQLYNLEK